MKLRCFTSFIAMVIIASTAGAAEIYNKNGNVLNILGNISGGYYFSKNNTDNGGNSFIRYGLIGKTYFSDKVLGFGIWEHEFPLRSVEERMILKDNGHSLLGYAGMRFGNLGSIDYGRNYGVLYDVGSWTDLTPEFGGDISIPDNFLSGRASNVITYRNNGLFGFLNGFDFAVQYQGKNSIGQSTGHTVKNANGEGYGVSASYKLANGIAASAAYANSKRTADQRSLDSSTYTIDNAEAYSFGIKYDAHGMYFAATYGETYNMTPFGNFDDNLNPENLYGFANKARNIGVVAQYKFDCGFSPLVSYVHSKASDVDNGYGNYLKKCVTIGTTYTLDKHIATIVDYRVNLLSKNDFTAAAQVCTDDVLALGISYLF